jgi:hypothetical protein
MRPVLITATSWLSGLMAYEAWLRSVWRQSMGGDWKAVAFWSAVAFAAVVPLLYFPAMRLVRARLRGYRPLVWFPLVAAALGVVPTALIVAIWGGGSGSLLKPEASLFYVMFCTVGVTFGLGYAVKRGDAAYTGR